MKSFSKPFPLQSGCADNIALEKKNQILSAEDKLDISGSIYYVSSLNGDDSNDGTSPQSAWKTLERLKENNKNLKEGDAVLFERGSLFRQADIKYDGFVENAAVNTVSGVSYGAYGTGEKPTFYGSSKNYAQSQWEQYKDCVWTLKFSLQDAGIIVFNGGETIGVKRWELEDVVSNGDFYHDNENNILYLYSDCGNPSDIFYDIEIGVRRMIFLFDRYVHDVKIDNICCKYVGSHAIQGGEFNSNITITNCEVGWIGGSFLPTRRVRYGNGIQFWNDCNDILIKDCWVYQVYDAGLTFQGAVGAKYKNIVFADNLIQYCNYSIEFFIQSPEKDAPKTTGLLENIDFSGNIMQYAGYGVSEQRPNKGESSQICAWITDVDDNIKDITIKNNIFDLSLHYYVFWVWEQHNGVTVSDNVFYMKPTEDNRAMRYGKYGELFANNQEELEKAVLEFDKRPKTVKWVIE